ncbi:hypothetical protein F5X99DRAFT_252404 [Biscogniauxia marginata]|nr:hypothetical protein F5X99DRAFT_252404 [Biscogniauxia marginata]
MAKIRPIPFRHKIPHKTALSKWKPQGPFRFLDLPPELRAHILELAILDWMSHKDVVNLFLTCRRLYAEAASMFYHEVLLDNTQLRGSADPFLTGTLNQLSPRLHVRSLIIRFCLEDQIRSFKDLYADALRAMVDQGNLRSLRLEVESKFPSDDFWGESSGDDLFCDEVKLLDGKGRDIEIWAPSFVTTTAFQGFLRFLKNSGIPKMTLYVEAEEHNKLWCPFHRVHASGSPCTGEWQGKARLLKVDRKKLVRTLVGAQVAEPA